MARPLIIEEEHRISATNRYSAIIEAIFHARFQPGQRDVDFERVDFEREDIVTFASELNIDRPSNWSAIHAAGCDCPI